MRHLTPLLSICCTLTLFAAEPPKTYFAPPPPRAPQTLGTGVQRTMTLLATSTEQHHNRVRILFEGQSITEQKWWKLVADDLRKRFPNADLEIENRAIGGFASQVLVKPAEHDIYPFYPDLVIFHVYGANNTYEEIIRNIRTRTTAEVLMQLDHANNWPDPAATQQTNKSLWWDNFMNGKFLPETAGKYGCGLADIRGGWVDYLKANKLEPKALLTDTVHLNDHGCYLMAELLNRHLVYRPELPKEGWQNLVKTLEVGKDVKWEDARLVVEFEGNRVDVLAAPGESGKAKVLIDGKRPSEFPECYAITPRPTPNPWSPLALVRVDHTKPLVVEDWTMTITNVADDGKSWEYTVAGSVTGADGKGRSSEAFESTSGRAKIGADAWFRGSGAKLNAGYQIKWKVKGFFADQYVSPTVQGAASWTHEQATTLAQGLPNGKHRLELIVETGKPPAIAAVRVHRPGIQQ